MPDTSFLCYSISTLHLLVRLGSTTTPTTPLLPPSLTQRGVLRLPVERQHPSAMHPDRGWCLQAPKAVAWQQHPLC
jgi:hypothetical protein